MIAVKICLCASLLLQATVAFSWSKILNSANAICLPKPAIKWNGFMSATASIALLTASIGFPIESLAATDFKVYKNDRYHTTISYPSRWEEKTGLLSSDRTVIAFVDPADPDTSISLAFNPIAADFTHLTSFGGKDNLRSYLLPRGEGVTAVALDESVKGESYFLEYIVNAEGTPKRHVKTVFSLRPAEFVVGLTAQTKEETYDKHKDEIDSIVPTFKVDID